MQSVQKFVMRNGFCSRKQTEESDKVTMNNVSQHLWCHILNSRE